MNWLHWKYALAVALLTAAVVCAGTAKITAPPAAPAPAPKLNPVTASAEAEKFITQMLLVAQQPVKGQTFAPLIYVIFVATDGRVDIETTETVLHDPTLNLLYNRLHLLGREQLILVSRNCSPYMCT